MARKKGGAWGNALGGFRTQKRNAFGQFGTGTPVSRGKKASFQSGGTPRYYAPGGKTYSTKNNGFVKSQGSSTAKQARRQAGINAAISKRESQAKKSARNRKIATGVAIGALAIGGAVAYQKSGRSAPADLAKLKSNLPNLKQMKVGKSARASSIPNLSATTAHSPETIMNRVKNMQAQGSRNSKLEAYEREHAEMRRQSEEGNIRAEAEMNGVAGPRPSTVIDDGHTAGSAIVRATAAGGVAVTAARTASDLMGAITKVSKDIKQFDEDGVAQDRRYVPDAAVMPEAYSNYQNLSSVIDGTADNRYSIASHKPMAPGETGDSWEKELAKNGVVMKEYGKTTDGHGEAVVQSKRAPMEPGVMIGSGNGLHSNVGLRRGAKASKGGIDIHEDARGKSENKLQADYAEGLIMGPNAGKSRNVRSTGTPVKIEASDVAASKATAGDKTIRNWKGHDSEGLDSAIKAQRSKDRRKEAWREAGGKNGNSEAFPQSTEDPTIYNKRGQAVGRGNRNQDKFDSELREFKKTLGPNPLNGEQMSSYQQEQLADYLGKTGKPVPLTGQKVRGSHDDGYQALSPGAQEDFADKFLESYEKFVSGGGKPDRYNRQRAAFFRGELASHPVDARAQLSKAENARINARARARNRKAN